MSRTNPSLFNGLSLKARVLSVVVVLLVVGIWGLVVRVTDVLKADLENLLSDELSSTVRYVAEDFDESVRLHLTALQDLSRLLPPAVVADPAAAGRALSRAGISATLFPFGVFVANRDGVIVADGGPSRAGRIGRSVADRPYFREALAGGHPVVSGPLLGRATGQPAIVFAVPLQGADGRPAGVLVGGVGVTSDGMFGDMRWLKPGRTGYFIVASPRDRVIVAAADKSRILQPLPAPGVVPLLDRRVEQGFEGTGITTNSSGVEVLTASHNMKTTGWIVLVAIPTSDAFAPLATIRSQVYVSALAVTLFVAAILGYVLKRQLAPLAGASEAMHRMTGGQEPFTTLPIARNDEIGRLVASFNELVLDRKRAEDELRNHRDRLQERVREQTADLLRAKEAAESASRAKSVLLANISHELRTPLQVIMSFSGLGKIHCRDAEREVLNQYFGSIQSGCKELSRLIGDLLDLSRLEAGKVALDRRPTDVAGVARGVGAELGPLFAAKDLVLDMPAASCDTTAEVDPARIAQVLRNLLSNAIKFSPRGGRIVIAFGEAEAAAGQPGPGLLLTVTDEGIGIPGAELEAVFGKFVQSSRTDPSSGGAGLGLSICREIVEAHGGSISASNGAAGGARLQVFLPRPGAGREGAGPEPTVGGDVIPKNPCRPRTTS